MRNAMLYPAVIALLSYSTLGFAATEVESMDMEGTTHKMWVQEKLMRVNTNNESNYMLFNAADGKMYSVNPDKKQVIDLSSLFAKESPGTVTEKQTAKFIKVGKGPAIAGYATEEYQFIANGQTCAKEFLSVEALLKFRSLDIFEALSKFVSSVRMNNAMGKTSPCDSTQISFDKTYPQLGIPLRIIDRNGSLESEIVRIADNVSVPADWFDVPAGYEVVNLGQIMQQRKKGYYPGQGGRMLSPAGNNAMGKEADPEKLQQIMQEMMQQRGRGK